MTPFPIGFLTFRAAVRLFALPALKRRPIVANGAVAIFTWGGAHSARSAVVDAFMGSPEPNPSYLGQQKINRRCNEVTVPKRALSQKTEVALLTSA